MRYRSWVGVAWKPTGKSREGSALRYEDGARIRVARELRYNARHYGETSCKEKPSEKIES